MVLYSTCPRGCAGKCGRAGRGNDIRRRYVLYLTVDAHSICLRFGRQSHQQTDFVSIWLFKLDWGVPLCSGALFSDRRSPYAPFQLLTLRCRGSSETASMVSPPALRLSATETTHEQRTGYHCHHLVHLFVPQGHSLTLPDLTPASKSVHGYPIHHASRRIV